MVMVGCLAITPLAVPEGQAVDINNYEVITGISQDDYVLVSNAESGFKTVDDLEAAGRPQLRHHRRGHRQPVAPSCCSSWPRSRQRRCPSTAERRR